MQAPAAFNEWTARNEIMLADQPISAFAQQWRVDCLPVGLLADLDVMIFGTITTGTSTSGSWNANYFPWNLFNRLQLNSNQGYYVFDASGYSTFLIDCLRHRGYAQSPTPPATGGWNNTSNVGPRTGVIIAPSGALADSTAYKFLIHFKIPVAVDDSLGFGLILLQNEATRLTVQGTMGVATDFGTLGTGATISATIRVLQNYFSVPPPGAVGSDGMPAVPNTDYVHQWLEQSMAWTATGEIPYPMPLGGTLCRVIEDIQNNAAPQAFFATASDPTSGNLGNVVVQYGGNQRPRVKDFRFLLNQMREQYGFDMPQGVLVHDFSLGAGSLEMGFNGRDTFDTSLLTDFSLLTNISATPTNGAIRFIRELLLRQG